MAKPTHFRVAVVVIDGFEESELTDDIRNAGGQWLDREVAPDGNWLTSRQPADLPASRGR